MDLEALRREYLAGGLRREDLKEDPVEQFELWMQQAIELGINDPTAMTVATVDAQGQPSQRIVLLKHVDSTGFVFFTNYGSRKARELDANALISLHFPWHGIDRQVKICGRASRVPAKESLAYFLTRPRDSQLAAIASRQSSVLSSRTLLLNEFERLKQKFAGGEVPLPEFWGGIRVLPHEVEFWQGGEKRLHDRFRYERQDDQGWQVERLAP